MELKSSNFNHNESIPAKFTCDEENINPALLISGVPTEAKSLALIMDDPDATGGKTFDHWLIWNISTETTEIKEGVMPKDAVQGKNNFGKSEYGGPCPPSGNSPHRYMFKFYALDMILNLPTSSSKVELEKAMDGHILDQTVLIGMYNR